MTDVEVHLPPIHTPLVLTPRGNNHSGKQGSRKRRDFLREEYYKLLAEGWGEELLAAVRVSENAQLWDSLENT